MKFLKHARIRTPAHDMKAAIWRNNQLKSFLPPQSPILWEAYGHDNHAAERVKLAGDNACFGGLRKAWNIWKKDIKRNAFGTAHKYRYIVEANVHTKIEAQGIRAYAQAVKAGRANGSAISSRGVSV